MTLYTIYTETFLERIRQNQNLKGIQYAEKEIKLSAFADDTTIYVRNKYCIKEVEKAQSSIEPNATDCG